MKHTKSIYDQFLMADKDTIKNCICFIMAPFSVLGVWLFLSSSPVMMKQEAVIKSAAYKTNMESIQKSVNTLQKVSTTGLTFLSNLN